MFSRLTTVATATFAILAAASLGLAAHAQQSSAGASKAVRTVQLERVVITAKRLPLTTVSSI